MHGAGLVNAFFMRPGAALIEIYPCRFGDEHQKNYYWHPSHVEMQTYAFQVYVTDETGCLPSELQKHPDGDHYKCLPLRLLRCSLMPASLCPSHVAIQIYAFQIDTTD